MFEEDEREWARQLFGGADVGDERRRKRLQKVGEALAGKPDVSLDGAFSGDPAGAEGAQRLIRNEAVTAQAIFDSGASATALCAKTQAGLILAVEDTTTLGFPHPSAREMGDVGGPKTAVHRGFLVHSVLLYGLETKAPIGLISQQRWERKEARGKKHLRKSRPYEEKESVKWQRASEEMRARLDAQTLSRTISVTDRESDVWEYLVDKTSHSERFVARVSWNRRVVDERETQLASKLESLPVLGNIDVEVSAKGGRPARRAQATLRAGQVTLNRPARHVVGGPTCLPLRVVWLVEENAPEGVEPLEWRLYTSEAVETREEALFVTSCYRCRWLIEDWHKAWKTGCGVEKSRQRTAQRLEKMAVLLGFVAVRLLQLRDLASHRPRQSCTSLLLRDEWLCLWLSVEKKKKPPKQAPSLLWAYQALGKLGGFRDTQRTGRIGWITLWKGWERLAERMKGVRLAQSLAQSLMELRSD